MPTNIEYILDECTFVFFDVVEFLRKSTFPFQRSLKILASDLFGFALLCSVQGRAIHISTFKNVTIASCNCAIKYKPNKIRKKEEKKTPHAHIERTILFRNQTPHATQTTCNIAIRDCQQNGW